MEQEQKKSPVEIVQTLLAVYTTRREAIEKIAKNESAQNLQSTVQPLAEQSERFSKALLNELSEFGDAVQSEVSRDDEYHQVWNKVVSDADTMEASSLSETFKNSESILVNIYSRIINENTDLPAALTELLTSQLNELKQTS